MLVGSTGSERTLRRSPSALNRIKYCECGASAENEKALYEKTPDRPAVASGVQKSRQSPTAPSSTNTRTYSTSGRRNGDPAPVSRREDVVQVPDGLFNASDSSSRRRVAPRLWGLPRNG